MTLVVAMNLPKPANKILALARCTVDRMSASSFFPAPSPPLSTLLADIDALTAAEANVLTRTKGSREARDAKLAVLRRDLKQLASYVQSIADANGPDGAAVVESTGFSVKRPSIRTKPAFQVLAGQREARCEVGGRPRTLRVALQHGPGDLGLAPRHHAVERDCLGAREAHRVLLPEPRDDEGRSGRLGKGARVLALVSQRAPISRLALIPRALGVPTSRATRIPRVLGAPLARGTRIRRALDLPLGHGMLIPRSPGVPGSRGTLIPRALGNRRGAFAVPTSRRPLIPGTLGGSWGAAFVGRASLVTSVALGTLVSRARRTSSGAALVSRASLASPISRRTFVPGAVGIPRCRRAFFPRETGRSPVPVPAAAAPSTRVAAPIQRSYGEQGWRRTRIASWR